MPLAALCLVIAAMSLTPVAAGKQPSPGENKLTSAIARIEVLMSRALRKSSNYRTRRDLTIFDFGLPIIRWKPSPTGHDSLNPDSEHFKTLIYFAVCRENTRALTALFRLNDIIYGGLFWEIEIEFLHSMARRKTLQLDFRGSYRRDYGVLPDDHRSINRRRDIVRFVEAGDIETARRLIWYFHRLCAPLESHIDEPPGVLPRSITTAR